MIGPAIRMPGVAVLPFAQLDGQIAGRLQKGEGEVGVGSGQEAGDAGGAVEAVCVGAGGEDGARGRAVGRGGGGVQQGGGDARVRVEVPRREGVGQ